MTKIDPDLLGVDADPEEFDLRDFSADQVEIPDLHEVVALDLVGEHEGKKIVLYELQPKQFRAYCQTPLMRRPDDPGPRHIGYGGAAGGGKSLLARAVAVATCIQWPGCNVLIIRRTQDEVKQNHVKPFKKECPEVLPDGRRLYSWNGSELAGCATFSNGSSLYFGFMKEEGDEDKYQGNEYDCIVFEEATHYLEGQVRYLTGERLRATTNRSRPFALYPSNPGGKGHQYYKRLFIDRRYNEDQHERPEDYTFVQSYVWDNKILMKRDPGYIRQLATLPEPLRSWRLWGDWDAGIGMAVTQIDRSTHLVDPFGIPGHWHVFGAFDWGYSHPFSFGIYIVSEDERIYKVDTITGRRKIPSEQARYIRGAISKWNLRPHDLQPVWAGHDCWSSFRSRGETTPTIAEKFANFGFSLARARNYKDRVLGLNNLRNYLAWDSIGPNGEDVTPYLQFFDDDSGNNRRCIQQIANMPSDPDNPEDALKQDADEFGRGGDDMFDETRYAVASRPPPAKETWGDQRIDAWDPDILKAEADRKKRGHLPRSMREDDQKPRHPEFGVAY